jgi:hypothetical protein
MTRPLDRTADDRSAKRLPNSHQPDANNLSVSPNVKSRWETIMTSARQLYARALLCRERARTAANAISRANFVAFAAEYERQAAQIEPRFPKALRARSSMISYDAAEQRASHRR